MEYLDVKIGRKYLKHVVKEVFNAKAVRYLKITPVSNAFLYTNMFNLDGFYIKFFISLVDDEYKISVLFYDYYNNHSYMQNKTNTSLTSILNNKNKFKWYSWGKDFNLIDHKVLTIEYSRDLLNKYYEYVKYIKNNLSLGKVYYSGDGYGNDKLEFHYDNGEIDLVQGDFRIKKIVFENNSIEDIVSKINYVRSLNLEGINFTLNK